MKNKISDRIRIKHIYDAILEIESYIKNYEFNDFELNSPVKFATVKQLEIIGEAANYLTDEFKNNFSTINWKGLIGFRNILIHQYFGIDFELIWEVIKSDLPRIKNEINFIIIQREKSE